MLDSERFAAVCAEVAGQEHICTGIGTLSEKTLHAVLKRYYEPDEGSHEIKIGRYVADIVGENGIVEIQTAQFGKLKEKLAAFLEVCPVTVVHPVAVKRRLGWIDPESGEVSALRTVPRKDPRADAFLELARLPGLLLHPNLTLCFPLLEITEYRCLNPKQKNPKKHTSRCDRIPTALTGEWRICCPADYRQFLPEGLVQPFDSREFAKAAKCAISTARVMLYVFNEIGLARRIGKAGNRFLYEISDV